MGIGLPAALAAIEKLNKNSQLGRAPSSTSSSRNCGSPSTKPAVPTRAGRR